jgi:nicotinate-nucleotide adenylyltransferase
MKLGLFGGTFDPVHIGHLLVARAALEELRLDRVFFIPAGRSPFKPEQAPAPTGVRLAMLRAALAGMTWAEVDDSEASLAGATYSIETVRRFQRRFPGAALTYLIGADHVVTLPQWREAEALAAAVEFAACPRPDAGRTAFPPPFRGRWLDAAAVEVSSSALRARVAAGLPVDWLVPPPVAEFLRNNRLYL